MRKVSAVVSEGTARSSHGSSTTDLASKLRMPPRPTFRGGPGMGQPLALGCLGTWIAWLLIALFGYKVLQVGKSGAPYAIGMIITVIVVSILVITNVTRRREEEARTVQEEAERWDRMHQIWEELYYCSRDGVVFRESNTSRFSDAAVMIVWLAQQ
jgi:hypothetical protein